MVIKAKLGVEAMDGKEEEFKSLVKPYFDEMTKHIMQKFKLFSIQLGGNMESGSSNSSHRKEKKTYGKTIFRILEITIDPMNSRIIPDLRFLFF